MRGFLASSTGVTCAAALALPLAPPAAAATSSAPPATSSTARPPAYAPGGTQSLPLAPLARDRAPGVAEQGLPRRDVPAPLARRRGLPGQPRHRTPRPRRGPYPCHRHRHLVGLAGTGDPQRRARRRPGHPGERLGPCPRCSRSRCGWASPTASRSGYGPRTRPVPPGPPHLSPPACASNSSTPVRAPAVDDQRAVPADPRLLPALRALPARRERQAARRPPPEHHHPPRLGRRRETAREGVRVHEEGQDGLRAPLGHRQQLPLFAGAVGDPRYLPLPRQQHGLARPRLQLPRRQVRNHLRGPGRRRYPARCWAPTPRGSTPTAWASPCSAPTARRSRRRPR
ncbi:hypothetical protein SVIOM74S_02330 [Streptomyces violarus]